MELTYESVELNSDCFFDFVRGTLLPQLQPFDGTNPRSVDNCSVQSVSELFEAAGVVLLFLPPYSPEMMPIEEAFSYIKGYLKQHDDCLHSGQLRTGTSTFAANICKIYI